MIGWLTVASLGVCAVAAAPPRPMPLESLRPQSRASHPTVYSTGADVERARLNAAKHAWGRKLYDGILADARRWLDRSEQDWLRFLPEPGGCYAYGFTGCPVCGAPWGTWGSAKCSWDNPGHVTCSNGHVLPDDAHPDNGAGYRGPDGRIHYFVGSWNAWATEQWALNAIPSLARAYALTGDEKYAQRAAFFLDALASIYPESNGGSWDYPSSPPSGRLARPWYQVARVLVVLVEAYDLIYESRALDQPSLRPDLERGFPQAPFPQTREVKTEEAHGRSWPGMKRRDNIDVNLMQDAAYYCYSHTFDGRLHNGHADYLRGALAVGCLLGIPEYVRWATEGPYSIYAMLDNNVDRDGRYYETSLPYALHTRNLYLTFADPLRNWRDEQHPQGIDLYSDPRFRRFYVLPDLVMDCAGHSPNFGDAAPDNRFAPPDERRVSMTDYVLAEQMYSGSRKPEDRRAFAAILRYLSNGALDRLRTDSALGPWLLFHAEELPADTPPLRADLLRRLNGSWFLGQKGIAVLRAGREEGSQAALLRWGPTLNHGDYDELGLLYYAGGWQLTYDIGYGLASTHTQVGWASQSASHNLVVVNETSQLKAPGSGGSLRLFASVPGLQAAEASCENAYASENVSLYRRTAALIGGEPAGKGKGRGPSDPAYMVDIFRVTGGRQHDYFLGAQTQECDVEGVSLGSEDAGSLAGPDISWGTRIGNDGDVIGYPNKPYWNPPPGNGYGFFYGIRRGSPAGSWKVTWPLGGLLDTRFRAHFLPPPLSEAAVAKAPGLYPERGYGVPHTRNASYAVVRRRGKEPLSSTFVTVMEPYFRPMVAGSAGAAMQPAPGQNELEARPFIKSVKRLTCASADETEFEPVGLEITHVDGRVDYLLSGGLRDGRKTFQSDKGPIEVGGAMAYLRLAPNGGIVRAALHGADWLRFGKLRLQAPARAYEGTITKVDDLRGAVYTSARIPTDGSLDGQVVYFSGATYSRSAAYELLRVKATSNGSVLYFGETDFVLGRGHVLSVPDQHTILTTIPHEYACPLGGSGNSRFFDGKLVTNQRGARTHLTTVRFGSPMTLEVESARGFAPGDTLVYHDIQPGDRFCLPATTVFAPASLE